MEFHVVDAAESPAADLLAAMVAELAALYPDLAEREPHWIQAIPIGVDAPGGACLVGWEDGQAVCVGGLRDLGDGVCEIKRMYVVPEARGRGHAGRLLAALEAAARGMGYARVRLDTGSRQPHARRLYENTGYAEIPDYNGNAWAAFWGEKPL